MVHTVMYVVLGSGALGPPGFRMIPQVGGDRDPTWGLSFSFLDQGRPCAWSWELVKLEI